MHFDIRCVWILWITFDKQGKKWVGWVTEKERLYVAPLYSFADVTAEKGIAAWPPHNVSENVFAVHNSLHNDAVITLPIHVVSMINYWSNNRNVCTIYCTCSHRKLPLVLVDSHDLIQFFSFWNINELCFHLLNNDCGDFLYAATHKWYRNAKNICNSAVFCCRR